MQTTLHISKIDESLVLALQHRAQEMHVSLEELVRGCLQELVTKTAQSNGNEKSHDRFVEDTKSVLERLRGTWTEAEAIDFERNLASMRQIDPKLWNEPVD